MKKGKVCGPAGTEEHGNVTWLDTVFEDWNPPANYKKNGFLMAFLYNAGMAELVAPAEYSETKVAQIAQGGIYGA